MASARLDAYRAAVVAEELELAPPAVAATVVGALEPSFGREDSARLRRRCRRVLAGVSPDLLRHRARRARSESRLGVPGGEGAGRPRVVVADPGSGALVDPADELGGTGYRPGARLGALVRARDGRCRFPGCAVSSRFCDLDHVRPWPAGPTSARNLVCLCRRHHRVTQRAGWRVDLAADAIATWTDPSGRVRTTLPRDALDRVVLRRTPGEPGRDPPPETRTVLPDGPHSTLEHTLEHGVAGRWRTPICRVDVRRVDGTRWRVGEAWAGRGRRPRPMSQPPPF